MTDTGSSGESGTAAALSPAAPHENAPPADPASELPVTEKVEAIRRRARYAGSLALGTVGVVFGDIGTSPIYAFRTNFTGYRHVPLDPLHAYGVISLIFWAMIVIVGCKYVLVMMRADNHGEGGSFALLALITRCTGEKRWTAGLVLLGVLAASLFYGDCVLTPAISVLSAVEGLKVVDGGLGPAVVPLALVILFGLFLAQKRGSMLSARWFGPVMLLWFLTIGGLGLWHVARRPEVLQALSPQWIGLMVMENPRHSFLALGGVVLALTGAEALYADMGQFGRKPIALTWIALVFPCLILAYLGQCALLLEQPSASENPLFLLAPGMWRLPLVVLAVAASLIASQAAIQGAFSMTRQAIQLGFIPRMKIAHGSEQVAGPIYMPAVNWAMAIMALLLVASFHNSRHFAAAYGIAVTGTMLITTLMLAVLALRIWRVRRWLAVPTLLLFFAVDLLFFASNLTKLEWGGWVPLAVAGVVFTLLTTWARGRFLLRAHMAEGALPIAVFARGALASAKHVPGTAVFLSGSGGGVPLALLHNIKHNKVLHRRVVILTVRIAEVPVVSAAKRIKLETIGEGFWQMELRYGFLEKTDVPATLAGLTLGDEPFDMMRTSFFLSRQTLVPASTPGMALWREALFAAMLRGATSAATFFHLPVNRVVELGSQIEV